MYEALDQRASLLVGCGDQRNPRISHACRIGPEESAGSRDEDERRNPRIGEFMQPCHRACPGSRQAASVGWPWSGVAGRSRRNAAPARCLPWFPGRRREPVSRRSSRAAAEGWGHGAQYPPLSARRTAARGSRLAYPIAQLGTFQRPQLRIWVRGLSFEAALRARPPRAAGQAPGMEAQMRRALAVSVSRDREPPFCPGRLSWLLTLNPDSGCGT
jgi:hypothetical protein